EAHENRGAVFEEVFALHHRDRAAGGGRGDEVVVSGDLDPDLESGAVGSFVHDGAHRRGQLRAVGDLVHGSDRDGRDHGVGLVRGTIGGGDPGPVVVVADPRDGGGQVDRAAYITGHGLVQRPHTAEKFVLQGLFIDQGEPVVAHRRPVFGHQWRGGGGVAVVAGRPVGVTGVDLLLGVVAVPQGIQHAALVGGPESFRYVAGTVVVRAEDVQRIEGKGEEFTRTLEDLGLRTGQNGIQVRLGALVHRA